MFPFSVGVFHPGTQMSFRAAEELANRGLLYKFYNSFALSSKATLYRTIQLMLPRIGHKLETHVSPILAQRQIHNVLFPELFFRANTRFFGEGSEKFHRRNASFQQHVLKSITDECRILYGFDTTAWILSEYARKNNRTFLLDQTIGHSRSKETVAQKLRYRFPDWPDSVPKKSTKELDSEQIEHENATRIFAPSSFVKQTLIENGVPESKVVCNPYGTDLSLFCAPTNVRDHKNPVFLFVGGLTTRKGLPDLLLAWQKAETKNATLHIAGWGEIPENWRLSTDHNVYWHGKTSRSKTLTLMQSSNMLILPSYFEGLAQVQIEAASTGLPVACTFESGGTDFVEDGKNGRIIKSGDPDALANVLTTLCENPTILEEMEWNMRRTVLNLSWVNYVDKLVTTCESIVENGE